MQSRETKIPVFYTGFRFTYATKDMSEQILAWFQSVIAKSPDRSLFFAKPGKERNSVIFYTKDGLNFFEGSFGSDSSDPLFPNDIMVGTISADYVNGSEDMIEFYATFVANPKEDRKDTAELAMFRTEMINKYGM